MSTEAERETGERVALFPLNVVLFPGGLLPLRIFEPRYLRMVSECLRNDQPFAVAAIQDGPEAGGIAATAATGTLARIIDWNEEDDGLLGLLCRGEQMFTLGEVSAEHDLLLRASITRLPLPAPQPLPADLDWVMRLFDELLQRLEPPFDSYSGVEPNADHVAGRLIELLPLPLPEKQALLEVPDATQRLRRLCGLIRPEHDD